VDNLVEKDLGIWVVLVGVCGDNRMGFGDGFLISTARVGVSIHWPGYVENWPGWADPSIP